MPRCELCGGPVRVVGEPEELGGELCTSHYETLYDELLQLVSIVIENWERDEVWCGMDDLIEFVQKNKENST